MTTNSEKQLQEKDKAQISEYIHSAFALVKKEGKNNLDWVGPVMTLLIEAKNLLEKHATLPEVKN